MKKLLLLLSMLFAVQIAVVAQVNEDNDVVDFLAHLLETYDITVTDGNSQEITFAVAADYNAGVTEAGGIDPGTSTVTVEATGDWRMDIEATDFVQVAGPGVIPINNLGVWVEAIGTHQFGVELDCDFDAVGNALGLSIAPGVTFIYNVAGNAGDASDNEFLLHWLMGTQNGSMRPESMFDQISDGDFGLGDYTSQAILTLWSL